jgi:hypothetical protein
MKAFVSSILSAARESLCVVIACTLRVLTLHGQDLAVRQPRCVRGAHWLGAAPYALGRFSQRLEAGLACVHSVNAASSPAASQTPTANRHVRVHLSSEGT